MKRKQFESEADFQAFKEDARKTRAEAEKELASGFFLIDKDTIVSKDGELHEIVKFDKFLDKMGSVYARYLESLRYEIINNKEEFEYLASAPDYVTELEPYFITLLNESNMNLSLAAIYHQCYDENWQPIKGNPFSSLIEQARKSLAEVKSPQDLLEITVKHTDLIQYPLDKPNNVIWNLLEAAAPNGQLKLNIDTSKGNSKQGAIILYGIDFANLDPNLHITQQLTPFDKRVYIATASLFNGGNEYMTATQICRQMGNTGRPSKSQLKKINDSLTKMGAARVYIDNKKEAETHKKTKFYKYDAALLPFERISEAITINGQIAESTIHLLKEPPLITFAKQRNQITTFKRNILESPINKTDANLRIDDYLIERISQMKNSKRKTSNKMLYETIYKNCNITTKMQKQRAPEKIKNYLDHYKSCDFIKGYKEGKDGITIIL